jgi:DNA polymerase-3 subunit epsilon
MRNKLKFALVLGGCLAFLALALALISAVVWSDFPQQEKEVLRQALLDRVALMIFLSAIAAVAIGLALQGAFNAYVSAPLRLAEQARIIVGPNRAHRLNHDGAPELRALADSVNELAEQRDALQRDVEEKIEQARRSLEVERNRLAALMSELTQSVLVCNLDGRILLYNHRARLQARALADGAGGSGLIGLGRSIFGVFDRGLIAHALENIEHRRKRGGSQPITQFVTTTRAGQLLRVQMAPVLSGQEESDSGEERQISGYVLLLDNITRTFELDAKRDEMLQTLTEGSRASLANIRAAVETLLAYPDMEQEQRDRFVGIVGEEARALSHRLDRTVNDYADSLKARWPLEEMLGADLVAAAQRRIDQRVGLTSTVERIEAGLWIRVDSFSLLQALTYLAARLKEEYEVRELRFRLAGAGRLAHLDMIWSGRVVGTQTLMEWELEPMKLGGEPTPLTLRDIMDRHDGEIWLQRETATQRAFFRLLVPSALPQEELEPALAVHRPRRPDYYDFDLFKPSVEHSALDERPLTDLAYTVFDTETTGLEPSAGDEIIQIGALRVVNGRILRQESFEQLIDPGRPMSKESIRITSITPEMLKGQPRIETVLPAFHAFCEDTVLVAHNAAFDMRFLQLKEESTGVRFTQPVLDTLLLSPVIHPNQESHRIEAIAERLGVNVIGRHTALGDAIVTGEVFLRMIPLLGELGIRTLGQAREAAQRTYYARVKY